ncbi:MAG: hypothetical protein K2O17_08335 [Bacteroidaceae bacterium]|nr:hypothetical protein [Bacteroidaceae bacterium]
MNGHSPTTDGRSSTMNARPPTVNTECPAKAVTSGTDGGKLLLFSRRNRLTGMWAGLYR